MAENKVFRDPQGIVNIVFVGDQTYESLYDINKEAQKIVRELRAQQKPGLVLSDLSGFGKFNTGTVQAAAELMYKADYDKSAVFGANEFIKNSANMLIAASFNKDKIHYFNTKEEAIAWLFKQDSSQKAAKNRSKRTGLPF